jgi:hypothetical protein
MANEFKHVSVGTDLSQAEWEATAGHVLNSQATGDLIYASSASQLTRLGIGSTNQALGVTGGIPAWQASSKSVLTTTGDVMYASAANVPARLGIGSTSQVLTVAGGVPTWATPSGSAWSLVTSGTYTGSGGTVGFTVSGISGYTKYQVIVTVLGGNYPTPGMTINGNGGAAEYQNGAGGYGSTGSALTFNSPNYTMSPYNTSGNNYIFFLCDFYPMPNSQSDASPGKMMYQIRSQFGGITSGVTANSTGLSSFTMSNLAGGTANNSARYVVYGAA